MQEKEFMELLDTRRFPSVSLFLPTHKAGPEIRQDPIRLKNLAANARQQLEALDVSKARIDKLFAPLEPWFQSDHFWRRQNLGLAVFLSEAGVQPVQVPFALEELAVAAERFYVRPLIPLFRENGDFYVLGLSQAGVKLYRGGRFEFRELPGEELPAGLQEILDITSVDADVGFHPAGAAGGQGGNGRPNAQYHGLGDTPKDYMRVEVDQYVHQVANAVNQHLKNSTVPLVLLAEDRLQGVYRQHNDYPHLMAAGIHHHPGDIGPEDIHAEAWKLIQSVAETKKTQALERFWALYNDGDKRADRALPSVLPAARSGRVETLFTVKDRHVWGRFYDDYNVPKINTTHHSGDEDLIDLAAAFTLRSGGAVYAVDDTSLPDEGGVSAIYRY